MKRSESYPSDAAKEVRALQSAYVSGDTVPSRILLAPWGQVESTNGSFVVDDESVRLAIEAFTEHATDLPIDYEHQTLGGSYASPTGQAPAAGWIKRLVAEPGVGLLADIEWTQRGRELLASRQYRYLSPVAIVRKADRKLVAVHSAALTNKPAIVGMAPIVNGEEVGRSKSEERSPEFQPSDFDLHTSIFGPCRTAESAYELLCGELGLPPETGADEVLLAASRRLTELRAEQRRRRVDDQIRRAVAAGKLVEAQRTWAEALIAREENLFEEWFRTAPVVVMPGASAPPLSANDSVDRRRQAAAARARAEFRSTPLLAALTTEEAFVADAVRSAA